MLAVPVLAGSAAYGVAEMIRATATLDAKPRQAPLFYGTIAATTFLGCMLEFVGIDPARALYWAAVVNGVLAGPLMVVMMLIVRNPRAMGLTLSTRATDGRLDRHGRDGDRLARLLRLHAWADVTRSTVESERQIFDRRRRRYRSRG